MNARDAKPGDLLRVGANLPMQPALINEGNALLTEIRARRDVANTALADLDDVMARARDFRQAVVDAQQEVLESRSETWTERKPNEARRMPRGKRPGRTQTARRRVREFDWLDEAIHAFAELVEDHDAPAEV